MDRRCSGARASPPVMQIDFLPQEAQTPWSWRPGRRCRSGRGGRLAASGPDRVDVMLVLDYGGIRHSLVVCCFQVGKSMATVAENGVAGTGLEPTPPPFLRRIQIRGYKSIAFCDVHLQPLTILVGRNAAGKSNFVDALGFLRDSLEGGLDSALEGHGGASLFCKSLNTNHLAFELGADFGSYEMLCRAVYRVDLQMDGHRQLKVHQEALQLDDLTHGRHCEFAARDGDVKWDGLDHFHDGRHPLLFDQYRPDRLLLGVIGGQPFVDLAEGIRTIGCFNFDPEAMRAPQRSSGSPALQDDGRNLARAIVGLKEIDEDAVARVKMFLRAFVPEIDGFEVVQLGDYETIRFRMRIGKSGKFLDLDASSMSDGTLRALAALVAAFQIVLPHGYPGLVAIEEPETALHPAAMRALVDALDEATTQTQVVLTTHSAELLDNPTLGPENIRTVQLIDGQTVIAPIDAGSVDIIRRRLNTLGGLERDSLLEPDLDDLERQKHLAEAGQETSG
jgi:predicted ATPase